jgi:glycosyltransferase involved in cell wall biosynthesis
MDNFITYEYDNNIPSDLSSNTVLMIGRADDVYKRYYLGILAMEYLIKEITEIKMKIISRLDKTEYLKSLIYNLNLENIIDFVGFNINPEIYFKNSSLHLFPTLTETFSQVLCETKIYGIPTILLGLDYLSLSKLGTIIIYDEIPEVLAKVSLKLMKNKKYRKKIGKIARNSMKKFNNMLLSKKWVKLLLSVYNSYNYYQILQNNNVKLSNETSFELLINQINLIKKRKLIYSNLTIDNFLNYSYWANYYLSF